MFGVMGVMGVGVVLGARVVLVGDAGAPEVLEARGVMEAGGEGSGEIREIVAVMRGVRAEIAAGAEAVIVLGDNFYGPGVFEAAPVCGPGAHGRGRLAEVVERYEAFFGGISVPIYAVLGNHDVGHGVMWRWRARRACSVEAMAAAGWGPPGGIGAVPLGDGVIRLIDTNRLLRGGGERAQAAALRGDGGDGEGEGGDGAGGGGEAHWELWAGHHAWSLAYEKGYQPARLRRRIGRWDVQPEANRPTIWVNGHAHHQEASLHRGVLAVTSGSGSKHRDEDRKRADPPDTLLYADPRRGWTVLDIREGAGDDRGSAGGNAGGSPLTVTVTAHTWDGDTRSARCSWGPGWRCGTGI